MKENDLQKKHCASVVDCHGAEQNCWAQHDVPSRNHDNDLLNCCHYTYLIVSKIAEKNSEEKVSLYWCGQDSEGDIVVDIGLSDKEIRKLMYKEERKEKEK